MTGKPPTSRISRQFPVEWLEDCLWLPRPPWALRVGGRDRAKKEPSTLLARCWAFTWRRPTFTGPIVPLSSALGRFTSGFGMGPGGSTPLWSPEGDPESFRTGLWGSGRVSRLFLAFKDFSVSAFTFCPLPGIHTESVVMI